MTFVSNKSLITYTLNNPLLAVSLDHFVAVFLDPLEIQEDCCKRIWILLVGSGKKGSSEITTGGSRYIHDTFDGPDCTYYSK